MEPVCARAIRLQAEAHGLVRMDLRAFDFFLVMFVYMCAYKFDSPSSEEIIEGN